MNNNQIIEEVLKQMGGKPPNHLMTKTKHITGTTNYRVDVWVEKENPDFQITEKLIEYSYFINWDGTKIVSSSPPIEKANLNGSKN